MSYWSGVIEELQEERNELKKKNAMLINALANVRDCGGLNCPHCHKEIASVIADIEQQR